MCCHTTYKNSLSDRKTLVRWLVMTWQSCGFVTGNLRMPTCARPRHHALWLDVSPLFFNSLPDFVRRLPLPSSQAGIVLVSMMEVHEYWPLASHLKSESSSWNVRRHLVTMVTCLYQLLFVPVWEDGLFCVFLCESVLVNRYESESGTLVVWFVSLLCLCVIRSMCEFMVLMTTFFVYKNYNVCIISKDNCKFRQEIYFTFFLTLVTKVIRFCHLVAIMSTSWFCQNPVIWMSCQS